MISQKKFFVLLSIYVLYMLCGAGIFQYMEWPQEQTRREQEREERKEIEELLLKHYVPSDEEDQEDIFEKLSVYCGKPLSTNMTDVESPPLWNYYNSVFFVITVVTTIGYGHIAPTYISSRVFMIFYSLIGIPLNGMVMVVMGGYFSKSFEQLYKRWKKDEKKHDPTRIGLITQIILYLIPGFAFFIFLPAGIIMLYEGWDYEVAVYFTYVSLSTIGFGDYVAGFPKIESTVQIGQYIVAVAVVLRNLKPERKGISQNDFDSTTFWIYKVFLLFWIISGVGYLVMVLDYITSALQSSKVRELEHYITSNLKKTPQKIREELRTILNEALLSNIKRVYKDEEEEEEVTVKHGRSKSCPNLTMYRPKESPRTARKRAYSTCTCRREMPRRQSDTELNRIDKEKTFSPAEALVQPSELLMKVVNALGCYDQNENGGEGGIDCFSDSEILASEEGCRSPGWILGTAMTTPLPPRSKRQRAASEVKFPFSEQVDTNNLTWYGPSATKKLAELREKAWYRKDRRRTLSQGPSSQPQSLLTRLKNTFLNPNKDDLKAKNIDIEKQDYTVKGAGRRRESSIGEAHERYLQQTQRGRPSVYSVQESSRILESTTVGDLVRALSAVTDVEQENTNEPRRKLGTASLTPPRYCSPPRARRVPIKLTTHDRRCSLIPPSTHTKNSLRRFSLRPVNADAPPLTPTSEEAEINYAGLQQQHPAPPPYTPPQHDSLEGISLQVPSSASATQRKYSIRQVTISPSPSPVQRQLNAKRDREKDESSS